MERLGFRSIDSITVEHLTKHRGEEFKIHLMWMPREGIEKRTPTWNKQKLLEGVTFCIAHPPLQRRKIKPKRNPKENQKQQKRETLINVKINNRLDL